MFLDLFVKYCLKTYVLIIEDPSLLECIKKNSYDQFYNEHIYLFSAISVNNLIKKFNLQIFDIKNLKPMVVHCVIILKELIIKKLRFQKTLIYKLKKN